LAIGDSFGHEFVEFGRTIEHGELGVYVEMGERVAQHQPPNVSVEPDLFGIQISWDYNNSISNQYRINIASIW
jgi:hypothetical protein